MLFCLGLIALGFFFYYRKSIKEESAKDYFEQLESNKEQLERLKKLYKAPDHIKTLADLKKYVTR